MDTKKRRSFTERVANAFWALVGLGGIGGSTVDRLSMYGDDPRHDTYRLDFDLITPPQR